MKDVYEPRLTLSQFLIYQTLFREEIKTVVYPEHPDILSISKKRNGYEHPKGCIKC